MKTLQMKLEQGLKLQLWIRYKLPKGKKSNWVNEIWIRLKNHERICLIRRKSLYYLIDNGDEDKEGKLTKRVS